MLDIAQSALSVLLSFWEWINRMWFNGSIRSEGHLQTDIHPSTKWCHPLQIKTYVRSAPIQSSFVSVKSVCTMLTLFYFKSKKKKKKPKDCIPHYAEKRETTDCSFSCCLYPQGEASTANSGGLWLSSIVERLGVLIS